MISVNANKRRRRSRHSFAHELYLFISPFIVLLALLIMTVTSLIVSYTIQTNYSQQTISTSEQALSNYEGYFNNIINVSTSLQGNLENVDVKNNKTTQRKYLDALMSTSKDMISISLYEMDGTFIVGNSSYVNSQPANVTRVQNWFTAAIDEPLINHFSPIMATSTPYFTISHLITVDNAYSVIFKIEYNFTSLANQIGYTRLGEGGHIIIYNLDYDVIYSSADDVSEKEMDVFRKQVIGTAQYSENGHHLYAYLSTIQNTSWRIAIINNFDTTADLARTIFITTSSIAIVFLIIFFFGLALFTRKLTSPLNQLQNEMAQIEDLDFQQKQVKQIDGPKEIVSLNNSYLAMLDRIHDLALKVVQEEKEETKAQLQALQNQINPHFLYNTLDSIIYLIDEKENDKAEQMIVTLSRFFRLSISRGKNIIPLENELNHVASYLKIQKMRFGDSFSFDIQNHVKGNYFVIKLILQPIVENSLIHGFDEHLSGIGGDSRIQITATEDENYLYFELKDNGFGMTPEKLEEIRQSLTDGSRKAMGVGIRNIAQRIRLYYGEDSQLSVDSQMDIGTTVTIRLPKKGCLSDEE